MQIAAFTDDKGANALAGKLKKAGYASTYTEPAETSRGTLWRVRVGGFATRPEADSARAKLKTEGWNGTRRRREITQYCTFCAANRAATRGSRRCPISI